MFETIVAFEWLRFVVRWLHVITAIAWIGSSFYFIALDLGLRSRPGLPAGAHGEEWQVHGGGFYHIQKYLVAPAQMPEHLTWFKWESYATWLSGFTLLSLLYYVSADLYLVDPNVYDMSSRTAIFASIASLAIGWALYDVLCKSPLGRNDTILMLCLYGVLVAAAWGYTQIFSARAAFLHLGAFTATVMSANVFLVIIPNQKKVVADLVAGRSPDPKLGKQAKQRSTHNNYLTLPVLFLMLSNHSPLAFGTQYSWVIASLIFLMGVAIRHYFNSVHARKGNPTWCWLVATLLLIAIMWLSTVPRPVPAEVEASSRPHLAAFVAHPDFPRVRDTITGRCSMCHSAAPFQEGVHFPPKGVLLETEQQIADHAADLYLQAGRSMAMPPSNISGLTPAERALIVAWYKDVTHAGDER